MDTTGLVVTLVVFVIVGAGFVFVNLTLGWLVRPAKPDAEKLTVYECGEPTVGSAFVQFDLRFYVVALLFVIFDVEMAFFFPWAMVFGKLNTMAEPQTPPQVRAQLASELLPPGPLPAPQEIGPETVARYHTLAWIAFLDLLIFFGVLLVGFAYLWRRGDLDWVRSVTAQQPGLTARPT